MTYWVFLGFDRVSLTIETVIETANIPRRSIFEKQGGASAASFVAKKPFPFDVLR